MKNNLTLSLAACALLGTAASVSWATDYKIILMAGQSNMDGHDPAISTSLPAALQQPQNNVAYFNGYSGSNSYYTGGLITSLQPGNYVGPEVTLGQKLAADNPDDHFLLIKYAVAGSALSSGSGWRAASTGVTAGACYTHFQATVTATLNQLKPGDTYKFVAMCWLQGESDATATGVPQYQASLTGLINSVRSLYGSDLPFIMGGIGNNGSYTDDIETIQASVANSTSNVSFFSNDDLWVSTKVYPSQLHFDAAGQSAIGVRFANQIESYLATPEPTSLALLSGAAFMLLPRRSFSRSNQK